LWHELLPPPSPSPTGSDATYDIPQATNLETWHKIVKTRLDADEEGYAVSINLDESDIGNNYVDAVALCEADAQDFAREHGLTSFVYQEDDTHELIRVEVPAAK
jgi:hypothetical protein